MQKKKTTLFYKTFKVKTVKVVLFFLFGVFLTPFWLLTVGGLILLWKGAVSALAWAPYGWTSGTKRAVRSRLTPGWVKSENSELCHKWHISKGRTTSNQAKIQPIQIWLKHSGSGIRSRGGGTFIHIHFKSNNFCICASFYAKIDTLWNHKKGQKSL